MMKSNDAFTEISLRFLYKMKYLNRYEAYPRVTQETVAEHSYFVGLYTMLICDKLGVQDDIKLRAMEMALVHDIPETILSDIPHDSKEVLQSLGVLLHGTDERIMLNILPEYAHYIHDFDSLEEKTLEALIVKAADTIQVIQYCYHEISLGNKNMDSIYESSMERYLRIIDTIHQRFDYKIDKLLIIEGELVGERWSL